MNANQLTFALGSLKKFCLDRSVDIIRDFQVIPIRSNRDKFLEKTLERFEKEAESLLSSCPFELNAYLDSIENMSNFIPSVCITLVGKFSFLVYDIFANVFYEYMNGHIFINKQQACPSQHKYQPQSLLSESAQVCYYLAGFSEKPTFTEEHPLYKFIQQLEYRPE